MQIGMYPKVVHAPIMAKARRQMRGTQTPTHVNLQLGLTASYFLARRTCPGLDMSVCRSAN